MQYRGMTLNGTFYMFRAKKHSGKTTSIAVTMTLFLTE